jgi:hypothetical protein
VNQCFIICLSRFMKTRWLIRNLVYVLNNKLYLFQYFRKGQILFRKKKPLRFFQTVLWNWYHQYAWVFDWQHAMFDRRVFQQTVGIPMDTNCASLLADFFPYSYEADFIQGSLMKNEKELAQSFVMISRKLLNQWFLLVKLKSSHRKCYGRQYYLVRLYGISV